jgi:hypothetical protein
MKFFLLTILIILKLQGEETKKEDFFLNNV